MIKQNPQEIALFRFSVISPLVNETMNYKSNQEFYDKEALIDRKYVDGSTIRVSSHSIERWYLKYKKYGFNALLPKARVDLGKTRKLSPEAENAMVDYIEKYPRMNALSVYNRLIADSFIDANKVSYATINRKFNKIKSTKPASGIIRLRYEAKFANDIWCGDSSFGLYLYQGNQKIKLVIIAFIDDASRLIVSAKIYDSDNIPNLLATYHDAISKFGLPKVLNVDNGKNYRSNASSVINAKLGVSIHYDPCHSPVSKAKIERVFHTIKMQWMDQINFHDFKSIEEYQRSLDNYINKYNNTIHSSLDDKQTPMQRFQKDIKSVNYIDENKLNEAFLLEINRKSTFDSLITLNDVWYQLPHKFADRKVNVLYAFNYSRVYVMDDDKRIEVFKLDKVANSNINRRYKMSEDE